MNYLVSFYALMLSVKKFKYLVIKLNEHFRRYSKMAKLRLDKITKRFDEYYAAKEISFDVEEGEFVTLLGPSGCGKTTLLKMIAGFVTPDSGEIILNGESINTLPPERRSTAMCFQSYALFPHLNVVHNIAYGLKQKKTSFEELGSRVNAALKQVGLESQKLKMPSQLSGGQQQRVAIARAMVTNPHVMLFDEPLSNLDARLRESVRYEIKQLQKHHNLTSVYVTHDQSEALSMSDKIVVLNAGEIAQAGTPEEIYYQPANRFIADFVGAANIIKATVTEAEQPGFYRVSTSVGNFYVSSSRKPENNHCWICWRPEDVIYMPEHKTGANYFTITVESLAFMGSHTEASGRTSDGTSVRLQLLKKPSIETGTHACFYLPENAIVFLEPVT